MSLDLWLEPLDQTPDLAFFPFHIICPKLAISYQVCSAPLFSHL